MFIKSRHNFLQLSKRLTQKQKSRQNEKPSKMQSLWSRKLYSDK